MNYFFICFTHEALVHEFTHKLLLHLLGSESIPTYHIGICVVTNKMSYWHLCRHEQHVILASVSSRTTCHIVICVVTNKMSYWHLCRHEQNVILASVSSRTTCHIGNYFFICWGLRVFPQGNRGEDSMGSFREFCAHIYLCRV